MKVSHAPVLPITLLLFAASSAVAADATCKVLADANLKVYSIPTHIYSTEEAVYTHGKVRASERVYLNNHTYVMIAGKWTLAGDTPKQMADTHKDTAREYPNATCRMVRDESVDGQTATLYSVHEEIEGAKVDSQFWISKSRGTPLKMDSQTDLGGARGKVHRTMRYEYTNVMAPVGAK